MNHKQAVHRRRNPLTGKWVLISPHRNHRPWSGAVEQINSTKLPKHAPNCPLCPNNSRANGEINPNYSSTYVFNNDFAALTDKASDEQIDKKQRAQNQSELFHSQLTHGESRVVCFSPDHSKTLAELDVSDLTLVIATWKKLYLELIAQYPCVHIFENKGEQMGCSQPHPHGQIWAHQHLSSEIASEDHYQSIYQQQHGSNLLGDYCLQESDNAARLVAENEHWLVVVPYWASWPFETLLIAKDDIQHFGQLNDIHQYTLAQILSELTIRYDNIFNYPFPYSMGWHNAPALAQDNSHWRLHAHFYPPLLRSANIRKFMVGYEMLAESQRDLTAERAAEILRAANTIHYKQGVQNAN
ncbi:MAG: UDP-glucose--hexose-1-phosphate uridylyltransferase [Parashewanella sp.]